MFYVYAIITFNIDANLQLYRQLKWLEQWTLYFTSEWSNIEYLTLTSSPRAMTLSWNKLGGGIRENVPRECPGTLSGGKYGQLSGTGTCREMSCSNSASTCGISRYVLRVAVMIYVTLVNRQTHTEIDRFWPVLLIAYPAELKTSELTHSQSTVDDMQCSFFSACKAVQDVIVFGPPGIRYWVTYLT